MNSNQSIFESIKYETLNYSSWFNAKDHQNIFKILERYIQSVKDKSSRFKVNVYNLNSLAPIVQGIHTLQLTDWGEVDEWKENVWDISINGIKNIGLDGFQSVEVLKSEFLNCSALKICGFLEFITIQCPGTSNKKK
jgi:hypothetical protein